jgi:hypothetical protein
MMNAALEILIVDNQYSSVTSNYARKSDKNRGLLA